MVGVPGHPQDTVTGRTRPARGPIGSGRRGAADHQRRAAFNDVCARSSTQGVGGTAGQRRKALFADVGGLESVVVVVLVSSVDDVTGRGGIVVWVNHARAVPEANRPDGA